MARRRLRARVNWALRWGGVLTAGLAAAIYCLGPNYNPSFHLHTGAATALGHYSRGIVLANVAYSRASTSTPTI